MASRVLTICAAALLVASFALALLGAPDMPLWHVLILLDSHAFAAVKTGSEHISPILWSDIAMPVLLRPAWLLPACCALICGGLAYTLAAPHDARHDVSN